ncbi:collagen triple helix repeat-containing protein 1-like [Lytechinus variegatus]|uniref:collagen triple helix repeat-containing protein 1-like n=1 Tax=Lytechinus variegatus TaxID=7654 RepID=UPI001BB228F7|nr:collagen triple helix repeat-containing protein 1-like [Lytechinus variegatus]
MESCKYLEKSSGSSIMFFLMILTYGVMTVNGWGATCSQGPPGPPGPPGPSGPAGSPGDGEMLEYNNWKQCAWYSANGNDYDTIYTCTFTKRKSDSALWVYYGGNLRLYGCSGCCKRWYFTFNDNECSPTPIDGIVYQTNTNNMNLHRHRSISGYCHTVGAGSVNVKFLVGDCPGFGNYDAYTGWNSASRIIIKEVPKSSYGY